jgi:acetyl-CoA carboxylase biotin carboxyl carrier protein
MDEPGMSEDLKPENSAPTGEAGQQESQPFDYTRLKALLDFLKENGVAEYSSETAERKISVKFAGGGSFDTAALAAMLGAGRPAAQAAQASAAASSSASAAAAAPVDENAGLHIVTSPIVGTFYESSAPGSAAFVSVGDQVEMGQVLCIVEALKLMNEIESDAAGEIVKRFVINGQPIEYGQRLFAVRPRS